MREEVSVMEGNSLALRAGLSAEGSWERSSVSVEGALVGKSVA